MNTKRGGQEKYKVDMCFDQLLRLSFILLFASMQIINYNCNNFC